MIYRLPSSIQKYIVRFLVFSLVVSFLGCSIKLIAPYDETTEKEASRLQKQIDGFITQLIFEGGSAQDDSSRQVALNYGKFRKEYEKIGVDLRSLKIRTEAISLNEHTTNQVKYIIENFEILEARHKKYSNNGTIDGRKISMSNSYLRNARDIINDQFKSVLSLEIAKKRSTNVDPREIEK